MLNVNYRKNEMKKTFVLDTNALLHDPNAFSRIDNPYADILANGLNVISERFRAYPAAVHVMLSEGIRSEVAEPAANLL